MELVVSAAESLGVRGLACFVQASARGILIDPGLALGYRREGLLPHPLQVAAGEEARKDVLNHLPAVSDLVISHFHGDHVPLSGGNPFQMPLESFTPLMLSQVEYWVHGVPEENPRGLKRYQDLCDMAGCSILPCDGLTNEAISFSEPVPHGEPGSYTGTVMMTRIEEGHQVFVHASDIQLLADESVGRILEWDPDIVIASGPPLYRGLHRAELDLARLRARSLAEQVDTLILDHHLLRSRAGLDWLDSLHRESRGDVICAADFMGRPRRLLEASRSELYELYPVRSDWHEKYARGMADTSRYQNNDLP